MFSLISFLLILLLIILTNLGIQITDTYIKNIMTDTTKAKTEVLANEIGLFNPLSPADAISSPINPASFALFKNEGTATVVNAGNKTKIIELNNADFVHGITTAKKV